MRRNLFYTLERYTRDKYVIILLCISFIALLSRFLFSYYFNYELSLDSKGYYSAAINIVNGNGYSDHKEAPYLSFFYREPLTSYSYAACIFLYKIVHGIKYIPFPESFLREGMGSLHINILLWLKIIVSILQVGALLLFTDIIKRRVSKKVAVLFFLIASLYYPLIFHVVPLLREQFLFPLLAIAIWFWEKYVSSKKYKYLVLTAITSGSSILYLQSYWVLSLFFVLLIIIFQSNWRKRIQHTFLFVILFFTPVTPWVIHVYQNYPDLRVVKTFGSALTYEYVGALSAYREAGLSPYSKSSNRIGDAELHPQYFSTDDYREMFDRSFNGTYEKETTILRNHTTSAQRINYNLEKIVLCFRNTLFILGITYDYGVFYGNFSFLDIIKFLFVLPYLIIGLIALGGLYIFIKKYWLLSPILFYHASLFFIYGDEERRQIMIIPYMICMAISFVYYLAKRK